MRTRIFKAFGFLLILFLFFKGQIAAQTTPTPTPASIFIITPKSVQGNWGVYGSGNELTDETFDPTQGNYGTYAQLVNSADYLMDDWNSENMPTGQLASLQLCYKSWYTGNYFTFWTGNWTAGGTPFWTVNGDDNMGTHCHDIPNPSTVQSQILANNFHITAQGGNAYLNYWYIVATIGTPPTPSPTPISTPTPTPISTYSAFNDFSTTTNPSPGGTWSYGYTPTLGGVFTLYPSVLNHFNGAYRWSPGLTIEDGNVVKNVTGVDMRYPYDTDIVYPGTEYLHFHPGPNGENSVVRFKAPETGVYEVNASFKSLRYGGTPTTTDIHVLINSVSLFDDLINGNIPGDGTHDFSRSISLSAGNTLDFVVGRGINGTYLFDSSGIKATIINTSSSVNLPPTVDADGPYSVNEGGSIQVSATGNDPENGLLTYAWDLDNNESFETPGQSVNFSAANRNGPDTKTITVQVTDDGNLTATDQATVDVDNVAPTVGVITAPTEPVLVNMPVYTNVSFSDPGVPDTHTAVWNWGDGNSSSCPSNSTNCTLTESNGSGTVTGSHIYITPGVYEVKVIVTDDDTAPDEEIYQYIVIYDNNANSGFVTGAGTIISPLGAYTTQPTLTGIARFGFVSKYQPGANTPTGDTQFRFQTAGFTFQSTSYQWLVVGGAKAQYKGTGTVVNDNGNYTFLLSAIDGQINGGGGEDKFRIKIWDTNTNYVIYDNQIGAGDTADPSMMINSGSIVIHH
ncbi:hypothetical protein HY407_05320 [Candidatus Gottesmanbacteria bacterium]|nr:hypothetical protein [Candidatus Gottesmanbacteria bacterium]